MKLLLFFLICTQLLQAQHFDHHLSYNFDGEAQALQYGHSFSAYDKPLHLESTIVEAYEHNRSIQNFVYDVTLSYQNRYQDVHYKVGAKVLYADLYYAEALKDHTLKVLAPYAGIRYPFDIITKQYKYLPALFLKNQIEAKISYAPSFLGLGADFKKLLHLELNYYLQIYNRWFIYAGYRSVKYDLTQKKGIEVTENSYLGVTFLLDIE